MEAFVRALLSIKPEFAEKIFSGEKGFEFRKVAFRRDVTTVVVYVTFPVSKIIGEFEIAQILVDTPSSLWRRTKEKAGVSRAFFYDYFKGKTKAIAIEIGMTRKYSKAKDPYAGGKKFTPPRSFRYL